MRAAVDLVSRLAQLGLELPPPPVPLAAYIPAKQHGSLLYVSGQLPFRNGELVSAGALHTEAQLPLAQQAAASAFLNALSAATTAVALDQIAGVVRVGGFVACSSSFTAIPQVVNGASELAVQLFGEAGKHARAAVGVSALPLDASVEIEVVFSLVN